MRERLKNDLTKLMSLPGLSGYEDRIRKYLQNELKLMHLICVKLRNMALARRVHQETANVTLLSGIHPKVRDAQNPEVEQHHISDGPQGPRHISTHSVVIQRGTYHPDTIMGYQVVRHVANIDGLLDLAELSNNLSKPVIAPLNSTKSQWS